jgi:hypothetical protein
MPDFSKLRWWHFPVAVAVLLIMTLSGIYIEVRESWDRSEVLAHGRDAEARVVGAAGIQAVTLEWTDQNGQQFTAQSKTGKMFARTSSGTTVPIKYDPTLVRMPVILSQVSVLDPGDYWRQPDMLVIYGLAAIGATALISMLRIRRMRANGIIRRE